MDIVYLRSSPGFASLHPGSKLLLSRRKKTYLPLGFNIAPHVTWLSVSQDKNCISSVSVHFILIQWSGLQMLIIVVTIFCTVNVDITPKSRGIAF